MKELENELIIKGDVDDWPVGTYRVKLDSSNHADQGTWVELDEHLVAKYNEYKNKLTRIAEIAEEAGNQLYSDSDGIGSLETAKILVNKIIKECE